MTPPPERTIARPPTAWEQWRDRSFRRLTFAFAWLTIVVVVLLVAQLTRIASPAIASYGFGFLAGDKWDVARSDGGRDFGVAPQLWGTVYSSILGVALGGFFGVAVAIFLTQDFLPHQLTVFFKNVVELLAAIPSVVYGLWGIFVVIPTIRPTCNWVHDHLGWLAIFGTRMIGPGLLPAALVLAVMVLPTVTAISRDALSAVPTKLREASFGLGATRWETILGVVLPTASRGIYGSIILAFGRALGETMALAMLVGNSSNTEHPWSIFAPADTLAALLANRFAEASDVQIAALMYAALVLLALTLVVNVIGSIILSQTTAVTSGSRK
jgi:phosphate transport system permease protein